MSAAALLLLGGALAARTTIVPIPAQVWPALLITGIFASALAFWIQTWAQQRIQASRAALILTTEPAFTVLFAFWLAGERFTVLQALGAALILGALFYNETRERRPLPA
jgi:drug/metabolite transporter (DMT)-like permease